ncbi:MAG TPA: VOC family protein [Planctomycetaceae bacterium]|nr:VOC family protein [Planctomycetaceae bacterium]
MAEDRFDHLFIEPADFDRAAAFYRDALGWEPVADWGGNGAPRGIILDGGAVKIVLAEDHPTDDHAKSHGKKAHQPTLHLSVRNLDQRFAEVSRHAKVVVPPETTHWGTRWFVLEDPDGNLIAYEEPS